MILFTRTCSKVFVLLVLLFLSSFPAQARVVPPDPYEVSADYALMLVEADGTISRVAARMTMSDKLLAAGGTLHASVAYKLHPAAGARHFDAAVSAGVPLDGLSPNVPTEVVFDLSAESIPAHAYRRILRIYHQPTAQSPPVLLAEFKPEQQILRFPDTTVVSLSEGAAARDGVQVLGPLTVLRERGRPKDEVIPFSLADATGTFELRLTNGTPQGSHRVAAAVIRLNGRELFRPSEFTAGLARQVTLRDGENTLEVRLRSAPGAFVTLELVRLDGTVCRALGPQSFIRTNGKPKVETLSFALNPQLAGPFTLNVRSGEPDGTARVDSAILTLNGETVMAPSDFNEQVGQISRPVTLQAHNTLSVELRGKPGDRLTLEIAGYDAHPPAVTLTSPADGDIVTEEPITVLGFVDDPFATVTVNGQLATVTHDGAFAAAGIVLQEGENSVTAVATDPCGNRGEERLTVHLQTAPKGPALTLCAEPFREQTPRPPQEPCATRVLQNQYGLVIGLTDETAVSVSLNGVPLPDGVEVREGPIYDAMREGNFFWAFVHIPEVDGEYPFTALATNASGVGSEATVSFVSDRTPPELTIVSPADGIVTTNPSVTIVGTVDDPQAIVRYGYWGARIPVVDGAFSFQVPLAPNDDNTIVITASDPAGNSTSVWLLVIHDDQPPTLTLATPGAEAVVGTPLLQVSGTVWDDNGDRVVAVVNSGEEQPLPVSGSTFSGTVALTEGPNHLTVRAFDQAGNVSELTREIRLDRQPPTVSFLAPSPQTALIGAVTVSVAADDLHSGIAEVLLLVDGHAQATLAQPPYEFQFDTVHLTAGPHTLTVRATDRAGNTAEGSMTVTVAPQLALAITSPTAGAILAGSPVLVLGDIYGAHRQEVGVTVNGVLAHVQGGRFAALVELPPGTGALSVIATSVGGLRTETTTACTVVSDDEPLWLRVGTVSGVLEPQADGGNAFVTELAAETAFAEPVLSYQWDFEGDGSIDQTGPDLAETTTHYLAPGLYLPTVTVTTSAGTSYTRQAIIHVLDRAALDALLQAKWAGMKEALVQADVETAANYLVSRRREAFREIVEKLAPQFPTIFSASEALVFASAYEGRYEYENLVMEGDAAFSYPMLFVVDEDGIIRIQQF